MQNKWHSLGIGMVTLCLSATGFADLAVPKAVVDEPVYNFGEQPNDQTIEHTFVVRNEGTVTLEITNIRSSCGCTVGNISSRQIEPGGLSEITAKYNLRGRRGPQQSTLTVETNDPANPRLRLQMTGVAAQDFQVRPNPVFFGQIHAGQQATREVDVIGMPNTPFQIERVESPSEYILATEPVAVHPYHHRIALEMTAPGATGPFSDTVRIYTTHPQQPVIHVQVSAQVAGLLMVAPEAVTLVQGNEQPVTRYIVVRPGAVQDFTVTQVDVPQDDVRVNILNMRNQGFRIQLSNLRAVPELAEQAIVIHTSVAGMERIRVPFELVQQP